MLQQKVAVDILMCEADIYALRRSAPEVGSNQHVIAGFAQHFVLLHSHRTCVCVCVYARVECVCARVWSVFMCFSAADKPPLLSDISAHLEV